MGADGGTIPRRDELVKTKKKPEKVEKDIEIAVKWKMCALSQEPLREPAVACRLGKLYNKEAVIEGLLNKSISRNGNAKHIKSIKDFRELKFTANPAFSASTADTSDGYKDHNVAQFICPVVGLEMNGKYRFCFSWKCGCVVSEKAIRELKSSICHKCGEEWSEEDMLVINGSEEEIESYRTKMEKKREEAQQAKKAKKMSKQQETVSANANDSSLSKPTEGGPKKRKTGEMNISKDASNKKPKSVQEDPNASKVYKSLFTSSSEGKAQPRGHWVTFNPQYF